MKRGDPFTVQEQPHGWEVSASHHAPTQFSTESPAWAMGAVAFHKALGGEVLRSYKTMATLLQEHHARMHASHGTSCMRKEQTSLQHVLATKGGPTLKASGFSIHRQHMHIPLLAQQHSPCLVGCSACGGHLGPIFVQPPPHILFKVPREGLFPGHQGC